MTTPSDNKPSWAADEASTTRPLHPPGQPGTAASSVQPQRAATAQTTGTPGVAQQPGTVGTDGPIALTSTEHVVELADSIVHIANQLHERILKEIACYQDRTMPATQKAVMHALMDGELLLRQHAQALYADASTCVIHGLDQPQSRLMALTAAAAEQIRHIGVISESSGLVGGILSLVGGIATGRLSQVEAALENIKLHHTALKALKSTPQVKP